LTLILDGKKQGLTLSFFYKVSTGWMNGLKPIAFTSDRTREAASTATVNSSLKAYDYYGIYGW